MIRYAIPLMRSSSYTESEKSSGNDTSLIISFSYGMKKDASSILLASVIASSMKIAIAMVI